MERKHQSGGFLKAGFIALCLFSSMTLQCSHEQNGVHKIISAYKKNPVTTAMTITNPVQETIYPPEIVPPVFQWTDSTDANEWLVRLTLRGKGLLRFDRLVMSNRWQPGDTLWEDIKRFSRNSPATLRIIGVDKRDYSTILSAATASFATSPDSVQDAIFYREVTLPFEDAVKDPSAIRWRIGSIDRKSARVVLDNMLVCGNCHSFSANGAILGMDVDYANDKGSYVIARVRQNMALDSNDILSWSDYLASENDPTFGLLSQISPDGRYVISTVKDRSVFVPRPNLWFSQLFFPIKGILAVYTRASKSFQPLHGADDPAFVQSNPVWSPDQRSIVFAKSPVHKLALHNGKRIKLTPQECEEFLVEGKKFTYDLYQVPFNEGKGGKAELIEGAGNNGMSNFFPRFSPDGKWIVFCKASSYMLLQPDSKLYIMPSTGGKPRLMTCNTNRMNSWHSFSSNSHWLVFSSKKNSPYTQFFLTHINERGEDSPPVLLEHLTAPDRAGNIPEFVNVRPEAINRIEQRFMNDVSYWRSGKALEEAGDFVLAEKRYRTAVRMNPHNLDANISLGNMLEIQEKLAEAQTWYEAAEAIDPVSARVQVYLGNIFTRMDRFNEAIAAYTKALKADPLNPHAHYGLGHLYEALENFDKALLHIRSSIDLDSHNVSNTYLLGLTFDKMGDTHRALGAYRSAVTAAPGHVAALRVKAYELEESRRIGEAIGYYDAALRKEPHNPLWHYFRARLLVKQGKYADAKAGYSEALLIHPVFTLAKDGLKKVSELEK